MTPSRTQIKILKMLLYSYMFDGIILASKKNPKFQEFPNIIENIPYLY